MNSSVIKGECLITKGSIHSSAPLRRQCFDDLSNNFVTSIESDGKLSPLGKC